MTITTPRQVPVPAPPRRRLRWLWLLLVLALYLMPLVWDTWKALDVYQGGFYGMDTRVRNLTGQHWRLDPVASGHANWRVVGLSDGESVKTWTDVTQNGHFGITTRIDGVVDPAGPLELVGTSVTRNTEGNTYPPNGSPVGDTSGLPATLSPGDLVELNLTWALSACHPAGTEPRTYSVSSVQLHTTVLGVHRTRALPLGFSLHVVEPACAID